MGYSMYMIQGIQYKSRRLSVLHVGLTFHWFSTVEVLKL